MGFQLFNGPNFFFFFLLRLLIWTRIVIQSKAINTLLQQKLHIWKAKTEHKSRGMAGFLQCLISLTTKSAL